MLLGALGASNVHYLMPVAPPGGRGGPSFPDGAFDQEECYSDKIQIPFVGKQPLIPPAGSLPPDVREITDWKVTQWNGHDGWGTAAVTRCGRRHQCLEALYDRETKTWYCSKLGVPCGGEGQPACEPVPEGAWFTWTDDFVQGRKKVPATEEGDPIFAPAATPTISSGDGSKPSSLGWGMMLGAAAIGALLLWRR